MRPVLVTIPISHFCEKARWALDRARIDFDEEAHLPFLHMLATRRAFGRTTPQLRTESGVLLDSQAILRWVDSRVPTGLYPADSARRADVETFAKRCDDVLGPAIRRFAYHHLLPRMDLLEPLFTRGVSARERALYPVMKPAVPWLMRKAMRIDAATAERSRTRVLTILDEVDARLGDGRPYLGGDAFTVADLTFGALASPLVAPPEHPVGTPPFDAIPDALAREIVEARERPAGRLITRLYAEDRLREV